MLILINKERIFQILTNKVVGWGVLRPLTAALRHYNSPYAAISAPKNRLPTPAKAAYGPLSNPRYAE